MSLSMPDASHRDWPPPERPWRLAQSWCDVLFLHWPMDADVLRARLPAGMALDTFDGRAWISVIPFRMADVRLRGLPRIPGTGAFPETNVRTYVTVGERRGVFFFSLDAASRLAVEGARRWFHLPYFKAAMRVESAPGTHGPHLRYRLRRTDRRGMPAELDARCSPSGPPQPAARGTLSHFLAERYCLYSARPDGTLLRGDVHHAPWPLQPVDVEIERCTLLTALGLPEPTDAPLAAWAARVDVPTWPPRVVWRGVSRPR